MTVMTLIRGSFVLLESLKQAEPLYRFIELDYASETPKIGGLFARNL